MIVQGSTRTKRKRYFYLMLDFKLNCKIFLCLGVLKHKGFVSFSIRYSNMLHAVFMTLTQLEHTYLDEQSIHVAKFTALKWNAMPVASVSKKNPKILPYVQNNNRTIAFKGNNFARANEQPKNVLGNKFQTYHSIRLSNLGDSWGWVKPSC